MVFLKDLKQQWPWNPNNKNLEDKEIYMHIVHEEDASREWRVPIYAPLHGFAFVGIRVLVEGASDTYAMMPRLVMGATYNPVFGAPWDNTLCTNGQWKEVGFPLTHRMIALTEDGMDMIIKHNELCFGKVEMIAQRFDDLMEDESHISYAFVHHRTNTIEKIMTPWGSFFKPENSHLEIFDSPIKIIPCLYRVLNKNEPDWPDTRLYWRSLSLRDPIQIEYGMDRATQT